MEDTSLARKGDPSSSGDPSAAASPPCSCLLSLIKSLLGCLGIDSYCNASSTDDARKPLVEDRDPCISADPSSEERDPSTAVDPPSRDSSAVDPTSMLIRRPPRPPVDRGNPGQTN